MFNKFLRLIYPDRCVICDKICRGGEFPVCPACREKIVLCEEVRTCKKCGRPVEEDKILCANCQVHPHEFFLGISCAVYEKELRQSVLRYKFGQRFYYHRGYAALLIRRIQNFGMFPRPDAVISVPLSKKRLQERGFDQAALIAKKVAKELKLPYVSKLLIKKKDTPKQSTLGRAERMRNVKHAFAVASGCDVRGKTLLLIDDIYTTGATADAASAVLNKAGAAMVLIATVAITR